MFPILCFERQWAIVRHLQAVHRFSSLSYDWNLIFVQTRCLIVVYNALNTLSFSSTTVDSITHITVSFLVFHAETTFMISLWVQFVFSIHSSTISTYCVTISLRMTIFFENSTGCLSSRFLCPTFDLFGGKEKKTHFFVMFKVLSKLVLSSLSCIELFGRRHCQLFRFIRLAPARKHHCFRFLEKIFLQSDLAHHFIMFASDVVTSQLEMFKKEIWPNSPNVLNGVSPRDSANNIE